MFALAAYFRRHELGRRLGTLPRGGYSIQGIAKGAMADIPELPAEAQRRIKIAIERAEIRLRAEQRACVREDSFRPYSGLKELDSKRSAAASIAYSLAIFSEKASEYWKVRTSHEAFRDRLVAAREAVLKDVQQRWGNLNYDLRSTFEAVCLPQVWTALHQELDKWLLRSLDEEALRLQEANEAGPAPPEAATVLNGGDGHGADRRKAVDAYIDEVFSRTGKSITRTDIWKSARYKSRTDFERWERNDRRATKTAGQRFTRILSEKPHLK